MMYINPFYFRKINMLQRALVLCGQEQLTKLYNFKAQHIRSRYF